jgi:hypothetical protein
MNLRQGGKGLEMDGQNMQRGMGLFFLIVTPRLTYL